MKPVIYIAAPFRAATGWGIEQNIRLAEQNLLDLAREGIYGLCPHNMTRYFHGTCTDQFWLDLTMELMRRCDAVWVCGEWGRSEGTKAEIAEALRLGKPVFYDYGTLLTWVDSVSNSPPPEAVRWQSCAPKWCDVCHTYAALRGPACHCGATVISLADLEATLS